MSPRNVLPVWDMASGRYKEYCINARRWKWADNKQYCKAPAGRSSSAPPGNGIVRRTGQTITSPLSLAVIGSGQMNAPANQMVEIVVPEIDWDAEERKSKMAKSI